MLPKLEETLEAMCKSGGENSEGPKRSSSKVSEKTIYLNFRNLYVQTSCIFPIRRDRITCSQKSIPAKVAKTVTSKDQLGYITHLRSSVGEHVLIQCNVPK
jgi:hypothetical protein